MIQVAPPPTLPAGSLNTLRLGCRAHKLTPAFLVAGATETKPFRKLRPFGVAPERTPASAYPIRPARLSVERASHCRVMRKAQTQTRKWLLGEELQMQSAVCVPARRRSAVMPRAVPFAT